VRRRSVDLLLLGWLLLGWLLLGLCFTSIKHAVGLVLGIDDTTSSNLERRLGFWDIGTIVDLADTLFALALAKKQARFTDHEVQYTAWSGLSEVARIALCCMVQHTG
jgi:hypothetical protein